MLKVIDSKRLRRKFLVYDLEWVPETYELRLIGVFDGVRYRCYKTVEHFLAAELNHANRGKWFYAHAGGLSDVQFLFEKFIAEKEKYAVKASFSGSSAIIVHVGKGLSTRNQNRGDSLGHDVYHFVDSYWLLRDTLKNIGKSIGIEKGGVDLENDGYDDERLKKWFRDCPLTELIAYNEQDCVILWRAIEAFQRKLWDFGGQLQMTLASSAMQLFRREYLSCDIGTDEAINTVSRKSYFSSRVEVFSADCIDSNYYDINSSFPYSMTKPVPGECIGGSYGRLPSKEGALYIAECDVFVPESYLPPLPVRAGGRVFFPVGRWRGWFNNVDLELLLEEGGKILSVGEVFRFRPFYDLAQYAEELFSKRAASTDDFEKYCYKLLLNSLYGKFAESDIKTGLHVNPSAAVMALFTNETQKLMEGVWLTPEIVEIPHMHVPISSHIVSNSRKTLFEFLSQTDDFHYTDCDGFSTGDTFPTSKALGGLKLEKKIFNASWVAPKLYQINGEILEKGEWKEEVTTKAKGFSLGRDKAKAEKMFLQLVGEGEIKVTRMDRVRQLLRSAKSRGGNIHPREQEIIKKLNKAVVAKRFTYPDGATRPWSIQELEHNVGEIGK